MCVSYEPAGACEPVGFRVASLTATTWEQCRLLPSAIKDAGEMPGKVAVVKLDPNSDLCFMYMYEVILEIALP